MANNKDDLTLLAAARRAGVPYAALRRAAWAGKVKTSFRGPRRYISQAELSRYAQTYRVRKPRQK